MKLVLKSNIDSNLKQSTRNIKMLSCKKHLEIKLITQCFYMLTLFFLI